MFRRPARVSDRAREQRRLLIASLSEVRGGAEGYAAAIAVAAAQAGWRASLAAPGADQVRPLLDEVRAHGVTHVVVPARAGRRRDRVLALARFLAAIARSRPQVIEIVLPWPSTAFGPLLVCALLRRPTVVVFQLVPEDIDSLRHVLEPRLRLYRWARGRRQTWVAVSDHARAVVAQLFDAPPEAIGRIYNGVVLECHDGTEPERARTTARECLGVGADELVLLSVGRLVEQKGHADLLRALPLIARSNPPMRLLIAGEGPERARLEDLISSLGLEDRVRLLGHVEEPDRLHQAADLFVFPSRYEGTPFAMLEAMASGLPVVATRFGGAEEVVEHGCEGLLARAGDAAALAAAIDTALADPERIVAMGIAARTKASRFSQGSMIEQTLAVLEQTAARR